MKKTLILFFVLAITSCFGQEAMYEVCPIKNSSEVPSAMVWDVKGQQLDLKKEVGDKPSIIVFYRGGWCPYCMRHLSALGQIKDQIDSLGFNLIGITPDDFTKLDTSISRSEDFDYTLLSDKDANAMNAFGVAWQIDDSLYTKYKEKYKMDVEWWSNSTHHQLPVPAVFIIKDGVIQLQHVDPKYSRRLSPELLLAMLKSLV